MAAGSVVVEVGIRWKTFDGDGVQCMVCGDTAWLERHEMIVLVDKKPQKSDSRYSLCDSCFDLIEDNDGGT